MGQQDEKERLGAFRRLFEAYEGLLLRYAARLTGSASSAEDVVQNTFVKFIRKWRKDVEVSPETARWLYRVAHNEAIDLVRGEVRRRRLHAEHGDECMAQPNEAPGAGGGISERAENAAQALSRLSDRERQLVILKVYEEKSYKEIAEITGLSVGNVGFILHTAMKKLAAMLAAKEGR
jgi:RNA polymerase sigma-70 factor (ECF subfamily)